MFRPCKTVSILVLSTRVACVCISLMEGKGISHRTKCRKRLFASDTISLCCSLSRGEVGGVTTIWLMAGGPWGIVTATWFVTDASLGIGAPMESGSNDGIALRQRSRWPVMATSLTP